MPPVPTAPAAPAPVVPTVLRVLPLGTFSGGEGRRGPWTVRDAASVIAASFQAQDEIPVDYDHQMEAARAGTGKAAPAAGWIPRLELRNDGIYAHVAWTPAGARAVAAREYRHLSPVFTHEPQSGEVTALAGVSLVNQPAVTALVALNNRSQRGGSALFPTAAAENRVIGPQLDLRDARRTAPARPSHPITVLASASAFQSATRVTLDDTDRAICARLGIDPAQYLSNVRRLASGQVVERRRAAVAVNSTPHGRSGLDETELAIARNLGLSPEEYRTAKSRR